MIVVRRVYIFLVSAISLNAVTWALISLLRGLLISELRTPKTTIALETAVIFVGLPIFLVHWLWAQRLAGRDKDEQISTLRRLYLFGVLAGFTAPFAANAYSLIHVILRQLFNVQVRFFNLYPVDTLGSSALYFPVAMVILAVFGAYHWRVLQEDDARQQGPGTVTQSTVKRLFIYAFTVAGLVMLISALVPLLRWLMFQVGEALEPEVNVPALLAAEISRLLIGLGLWLIFWLWAQRLFAAGRTGEQESTLRKVFLYTAVFLSTITVVGSATIILAGTLGQWLDAPFNGDIRDSLAPLIVLGAVWAYHASVLNADARQSSEKPQQAGIRRLYRYLVAGVGLVALLIGVGGLIGVLFFVLDGEPFIGDLRQGLAWFVSAVLAGLLVWTLPWRQIQWATTLTGPEGQAERESLVRRIYLYLFIFLATMTVLGTAVFIVSQLVELLLEARTTAHLLRDLGMSLAYGLIAVGIWLFHGMVMRRDGRAAESDLQSNLAALRIALLSGDQPALMERLRQNLLQKLPGIQLQTLPAPLGMDAAGGVPEAPPAAALLAEASVIISPATLALHNGHTELAAAMAQSRAHKLFVPVPQKDYIWLGLKEEDEEEVTKQAAQAIAQIAAGESVHLGSRLGLGAIISLIVGGLFLLFVLISLIGTLVSELFV